jgi:hypothetical protein
MISVRSNDEIRVLLSDYDTMHAPDASPSLCIDVYVNVET